MIPLGSATKIDFKSGLKFVKLWIFVSYITEKVQSSKVTFLKEFSAYKAPHVQLYWRWQTPHLDNELNGP